MELSKDKNEYSLKTNFTDNHLTNLKLSCLKQLEFTLSRISGAFNALF